MSLDAVLKIGGSLSRGPALPDLCREISRLGKRHSLLIVPGGGKFADQVRETCHQYGLNETSAHCMALLAMDQYGYILNQLIENSYLSPDLFAARETAESGRPAILLPSTIVIQSNPLPHSWQVTSDTIAAWVAQAACCPRLVLLKDVDGLMTAGKELITEISTENLAEHPGGVDEYLSKFLSSASLETWVMNGSSPGRLTELLKTGRTVGTKIRIERMEAGNTHN
jgi:5-(aminomethyl)-3-furanmethanol phosphate kinase